MIIVCTLCNSDCEIPLNEFLDLKDEDYICPECGKRIIDWVSEQNRPEMIGNDDFEEINSN